MGGVYIGDPLRIGENIRIFIVLLVQRDCQFCKLCADGAKTPNDKICSRGSLKIL